MSPSRYASHVAVDVWPELRVLGGANDARSRLALARVAGVMLSAFMIVSAFPPLRVRLLAFVALVPLLVAIRGTSLPVAALLAGLWGMLGAYGVTDWLPGAVARYYDQPLWLGATLFTTAAFVMGGAEYMAFGAFYAWAVRRQLRLVPLFAASAWVAAELGRSRLLTGNPWGLLGYTQAGAQASGGWAEGLAALFVQVADLGGVYAVSFVVVAINAALAEAIVAALAGPTGRRLRTDIGAAAAITIAVLIYGFVSIVFQDPSAAAPPVRIGIAQGNVDLGSQWREDLYGRNLDVYLDLTRRLVRGSAPQTVLWPENAMTFFVDSEPLYRTAIATVTAAADIELLAGAPRYELHGEPTYFNSAFVIAPDGSVRAHYDKRQLLPFAEYFPLRSVEFMRRSFARVREFTPGRDNAPLPTRAGAAGVTICNEAMFPEISASHARAGAAYLVNLSNDTWIDSAEFAEHQLQVTSLRAVEQRRYLVRASTSGPSAIIDPQGRIVARTAVRSQALLAGEIRPVQGLTAYARVGDLFAVVCTALTAACLVLATRLR